MDEEMAVLDEVDSGTLWAVIATGDEEAQEVGP